MQSGNIALTKGFADSMSLGRAASDAMTVQGTANKTFLLLVLCMLAASVSWGMPSLAGVFMLVGFIGGLIIAIGLAFAPQWAGIGGPIYALLQGLAMGSISALFNAAYPGIAFQAVGLTFGVLACMLVVYSAGIIKVTDKFVMGVVAATGGIFVFYMLSFVLSLFGISNPAFGNGLIGIGFSLFVVVIAALNLVLDFAFIEQSSQSGAPKYMEWYGAFGLMVTLVWLYLEILRLLAKLQSRD